MKFFLNFEGPVQKVLAKIGDFAILNILWLLCSLPIVAVGASTTALNYCTMRLAEGRSTYVAKEFFKAFKQNFRQATVCWLTLIPIAGFLYWDYQLFLQNFGHNYFLLIAVSLVALLLVMEVFYLFACIARFENSLKEHIKNAFLTAILLEGHVLFYKKYTTKGESNVLFIRSF